VPRGGGLPLAMFALGHKRTLSTAPLYVCERSTTAVRYKNNSTISWTNQFATQAECENLSVALLGHANLRPKKLAMGVSLWQWHSDLSDPDQRAKGGGVEARQWRPSLLAGKHLEDGGRHSVGIDGYQLRAAGGQNRSALGW
jgi:hypothetical protein